MDTDCIHRLTRAVSHALTRRGLVTALGITATGLSNPAGARKRKLKKNAFGCVNVGGKCRGKDANCCSGICQGKKPRKGEKDASTCVPHDEGGCQAGQQQGICGGVDVPCTTSADDPGLCQTTTGNAAYCTAGGGCFACQKDADCRPFCGPGAACIRCVACEEEGSPTACMGLISGGCVFPL